MNTKRIIELRTTKGHTQESLGELVGTDTRQIWRWENGKTSPSADVIVKLAQALDTSTDYLLGLTDDPTPPHKPDGLTSKEARIIEALRRGEDFEAIKIITGAASVG